MTGLEVVVELFPGLLVPSLALGFCSGFLVVLFGEALAGLAHLLERWVK